MLCILVSDDVKKSLHMLTLSLCQMFVILLALSLITFKVSSLMKLNIYLQRIFRELKPQLVHTKSANDVIANIVEKYNIINIDSFEVVLDIVEAKFHISAYKKMLTVFCEEVSLNMR